MMLNYNACAIIIALHMQIISYKIWFLFFVFYVFFFLSSTFKECRPYIHSSWFRRNDDVGLGKCMFETNGGICGCSSEDFTLCYSLAY